MKDEKLSQEDIEALFRSFESGGGSEQSPSAAKPSHDKLSEGPSLPPQKAVPVPEVKSVEFQEFEQPAEKPTPVSGFEVLLDVPLSVSVELGKSKCYVKDLINLTTGSVIELDRLAGDPVDVLVNGKLFARGEVVVIDENFGVRIREIVAGKKTSSNGK